MTPPVGRELARCPLDHASLSDDGACNRCHRQYAMVRVGSRSILDLRADDVAATVSLDIRVPQPVMPDALRQRFFVVRRWRAGLLGREELRRRYGTKLSEGLQHHFETIRDERGAALAVLDVGCGSGGSTRYLADLGFLTVTGVDWWSEGADLLADAHRLPFESATFDLVLATAVLEHCYLPHLAMREVARVLKPGGTTLMGASFWESWHGESFFHFTPNGIYSLCSQAGLELSDLWSGWDFIPAVLSHAVSSRLKRTGYLIQPAWNRAARFALGPEKAELKRVRTSGALQFRADKPVAG